jgi:hypothetical protein
VWTISAALLDNSTLRLGLVVLRLGLQLLQAIPKSFEALRQNFLAGDRGRISLFQNGQSNNRLTECCDCWFRGPVRFVRILRYHRWQKHPCIYGVEDQGVGFVLVPLGPFEQKLRRIEDLYGSWDCVLEALRTSCNKWPV